MHEVIHVHIHLGNLAQEQSSENVGSISRTNNPIRSKESFRKLMVENLWGRFMFEPFVRGLNRWMGYQAARVADSAGQSVELMGPEMEETGRVERTKKSYGHTRGTMVTPGDLTEIMIEKGFKLAEKNSIDREIMELYLEYNIKILGDAWDLKDETISQLQARIYQKGLKLAS